MHIGIYTRSSVSHPHNLHYSMYSNVSYFLRFQLSSNRRLVGSHILKSSDFQVRCLLVHALNTTSAIYPGIFS